MSSIALATLESVDVIKHKLTDQEYKTIVDNLQAVHQQAAKHYKIQYQVSQCYIEKVSYEDKDIAGLMTSESNHTVIVREIKTDHDDYPYPCILLLALRRGAVEEWAIRVVQEKIAKHGFYCESSKDSGCCGGNFAPWAGTKMEGTDVTTKIMIVKCEEYCL